MVSEQSGKQSAGKWTDELNNRNWLKQVGDIEYLTEIIESVPSASNIDEYIKIVEDKAILRRSCGGHMRSYEIRTFGC